MTGDIEPEAAVFIESGQPMFRLRLRPTFSAQKRALLTEKETPTMPLPPEVARALERFDASPDPREAGPTSPGRLWLSAAGAVRALLGQALGASLLLAVSTTGSTLSGTRLLRMAREPRTLALWVSVFFLMNVLMLASQFITNRLRGWVGLGVEADLARRVTQKMRTARSRELNRLPRGLLKTLITSDVRNVGSFFDNFVRNLLPVCGALLVAVPLLDHFAGAAGLCGLSTMALLLPVVTLLSRQSARFQARLQKATDGLTALTGEWIRNIRLIRFLSWQETLLRELEEAVRRLSALAVRQDFLSCVIYGLSLSWWMISVASIALAARWLGLVIDLPRFFGSIWLITLLHGYLLHIPTTLRLFANAAASMRRLADFLSLPEESAGFLPAPRDLDLSERRPVRVHFQDVSFGYADETGVLCGLSGTLDLSHRVALIGEVGAGKTTLARLLVGEEAPVRGKILVELDDGRTVDLWMEPVHRFFRQSLGYAPQDPFISNDTLLANVALGPTEDEAGGLQAAERAELSADLGEFRGGIRQEIGEGGVNLSGGQRQRLSLARAFYSGRPYLVLDDPLSAVDVATEGRLMGRLLAHPGGFFLVSHRLGELLRVDRVWALSRGRLVEEGDPRELVKNPDSHFNRVYHAYEAEERAAREVSGA